MQQPLGYVFAFCLGVLSSVYSQTAGAQAAFASDDQVEPNFLCSAYEGDQQTEWVLAAYQDIYGDFTRVILRNMSEVGVIQADFDRYVETTPDQPTDIRYRLIFGPDSPVVDEFSVLLWEGGFTMMTTAEISRYTRYGKEVIAVLHCVP